jgi:RND family efflux transporter MFP subunit
MPKATIAHGGNSHGDEKRNTLNNAQKGLVVPKDTQVKLGITTEKVREQSIKGTARLVGHVISDPTGYARLQATQNARIINDPDFPLPLPGQKVQKDQIVLALQPTLQKVESSDQRTMLYRIESEIVQLKREVDRKEKLGEFASQKDLENARTELDRAVRQKEEIINKTFKPEYLKSPVEGIVADIHVRPGEIVTPDKTIVEIVDPTKLLVEAYAFDPTIADEITGGTARLPLYPGKGTHLQILGVSPKVGKEDQAIHIIFKVLEPDPSLKLDMVVEVLGDLRASKPAIVIPRKAIVEDTKGAWVFIHTSPEVFNAQKVHIRRNVGELVEIDEGLSPGDSVVVEGAYLLNQAR